MSKLCSTGDSTCKTLETFIMEFTVLLAPSPLIDVLTSLFRCSIWRSFNPLVHGLTDTDGDVAAKQILFCCGGGSEEEWCCACKEVVECCACEEVVECCACKKVVE